MNKEIITKYFNLHAEDNLNRTENIHQAYVKGAEDCYDFMQEIKKDKKENENCKNWEAEYNCLMVKMDDISRNYEEKLKAKNKEIYDLMAKNEILHAKLEIVELIFGK